MTATLRRDWTSVEKEVHRRQGISPAPPQAVLDLATRVNWPADDAPGVYNELRGFTVKRQLSYIELRDRAVLNPKKGIQRRANEGECKCKRCIIP